jgi:hypothetical protein
VSDVKVQREIFQIRSNAEPFYYNNKHKETIGGDREP